MHESTGGAAIGKPRPSIVLKSALVGCLVCSAAGPLWAAETRGRFTFNGFGGWAYAATDGNRYLIGDESGEADNAQLALNLRVDLSSRDKIVAQLGFEHEAEFDSEIEYLFFEHSFFDAFKIRVGRNKHPYGIYGEVFDVGTIRPFYLLPQSVYGSQGITAKFYDGLGFLGSVRFGAWELEYKTYAGTMEGELKIPGLVSGNPEDIFESETRSGFEVDNLIGARVNIHTSVIGLYFGFSGYTGDLTYDNLASTPPNSPYDAFGTHLEFDGKKWLVRAEFTTYRIGTVVETDLPFDADGGYLEAAYKLTSEWQLAARYDTWKGEQDLDFSLLPPFVPQLLESTEIGLGINYWYRANIVFRANVFLVSDNRFAFPKEDEEIQDVFRTGVLEEDTTLFVFGAQFSF